MSITLYRDAAVIWERRAMNLPEGRSEVLFEPVPRQIAPRTATLVSLSAPGELQVTPNQDTLSMAETPNQDTLSMADSHRRLAWTVHANRGAAHVLEARYASPMIRWTARYTLILDAGGDTGQLSASLEVTNHSEMAFSNVALRVVDRALATPDATADADADAFAFVPGRVSIAPRRRALVPLSDGRDRVVPVALRAMYDPFEPSILRRSPVPALRRSFGLRDREIARPGVREAFELALSNAPARPLPDGVATVWRRDERGGLEFVGHGRGFTDAAVAERFTIATERLSPVRVRRSQTDFFLDKDARRLVEEIRVRFDSDDARVRTMIVREHMYRGQNWSVAYHNAVEAPVKLEPQTVRFVIELDAMGATQLVYRVVYTW